MGITFAPSAKSADAPDIEAGLYDARLDAIESKLVTGGRWQKNEDGDEKYEWAFTLLDDEGAVLYDGGDPVVVTGLTSTSLNTGSRTTPRALRYLKALMSEPEYALLVSDGMVAAEDLVGRVCQVEVDIRESGWPTITNVLPPRKRRVARKAAQADAE